MTAHGRPFPLTGSGESFLGRGGGEKKAAGPVRLLHREVSAGAVLRTSVLSAIGVHQRSALTAYVGPRVGNNQAQQCVKISGVDRKNTMGGPLMSSHAFRK